MNLFDLRFVPLLNQLFCVVFATTSVFSIAAHALWNLSIHFCRFFIALFYVLNFYDFPFYFICIILIAFCYVCFHLLRCGQLAMCGLFQILLALLCFLSIPLCLALFITCRFLISFLITPTNTHTHTHTKVSHMCTCTEIYYQHFCFNEFSLYSNSQHTYFPQRLLFAQCCCTSSSHSRLSLNWFSFHVFRFLF